MDVPYLIFYARNLRRREVLIEHGVEEENIHLELFFGYGDGEAGGAARDHIASTVTFTLSGRAETVELTPGASTLDAALGARPDAPYACMGGSCGTCRASAG